MQEADWVSVYDGEKHASTAWADMELLFERVSGQGPEVSPNYSPCTEEHCGPPLPSLGTSHVVTLRFQSDGNVQSEGFDALFSCESSLDVG